MRGFHLITAVALGAFVGCDDNSPPPENVDPAPTHPAPAQPGTVAPETGTTPPSDQRYAPSAAPDDAAPGANISDPPETPNNPATDRAATPSTETIDDPDVEERPAAGLPPEQGQEEDR